MGFESTSVFMPLSPDQEKKFKRSAFLKNALMMLLLVAVLGMLSFLTASKGK